EATCPAHAASYTAILASSPSMSGYAANAFEQYWPRFPILPIPARRRCSSFTMSMIFFLLHQQHCWSRGFPCMRGLPRHEPYTEMPCVVEAFNMLVKQASFSV